MRRHRLAVEEAGEDQVTPLGIVDRHALAYQGVRVEKLVCGRRASIGMSNSAA